MFPIRMCSIPDKINIQVDGSLLTVTPSGDLDLATAPALAAALESAAASGVDHIQVTLREVSFLDSTGLAALVRGWQAASRAGARFSVVDASPQVRRVLEITDLSHLLGSS
jgi:anti-sigma B factor antagonist